MSFIIAFSYPYCISICGIACLGLIRGWDVQFQLQDVESIRREGRGEELNMNFYSAALLRIGGFFFWNDFNGLMEIELMLFKLSIMKWLTKF